MNPALENERRGYGYYRLTPYVERFPQKTEAWRIFKAAVSSGELVRKPCEVVGCGDPRTDGHHPDYAEPLGVIWLCRAHHLAWHEKHGPGLNGGDEELGTFARKANLAGQRFGYLTAERPLDRRECRSVVWLCKCSCGRRVLRSAVKLLSGSTGTLRCVSCRTAKEANDRHFRTKRWTESLLSGRGLYGDRAEARITDHIRENIAHAMGFTPEAHLDADVCLTTSFGYDWAAAATIEQLDSPPLTKLLKAQISKKDRARSRQGGLLSAAKRKAA